MSIGGLEDGLSEDQIRQYFHMEADKMNAANEQAAKSGLLGFGTVIIENNLVIKNVRLYEGKNGGFLSLPQRKTERGYQPYVTCSDPLLKEITHAVMLDLVYQETRGLLIETIGIYPNPKAAAKGLLAFATVRPAIGMTISGIKIISGENGLAVVLPQHNGADLVYVLGQREMLNQKILEKYMEIVDYH